MSFLDRISGLDPNISIKGSIKTQKEYADYKKKALREGEPGYAGYTPIERRAAGLPPLRPLRTTDIEKEQAARRLEEMARGPMMPGVGDRALTALAIVKAERKLIATIRKALKEYDRYVKPDRRVGNGRRPVDPKAVAKGLKLMASGMSIRRAAAVTGTSFGTMWKAQQAKQMRLDV